MISEKKMENDCSCEGIADCKPAFAAPVIHVLLRGTPVSISQFQLLFSLWIMMAPLRAQRHLNGTLNLVFSYLYFYIIFIGIPHGTSGKEPTCKFRRHKRHRFDPWVGKISWMRAWQPTPVFLPGESHGQRSVSMQHIIFISLHLFIVSCHDKHWSRCWLPHQWVWFWWEHMLRCESAALSSLALAHYFPNCKEESLGSPHQNIGGFSSTASQDWWSILGRNKNYLEEVFEGLPWQSSG